MGRFPSHLPTHDKMPTEFAGKLIGFRIPYTMPGELIVVNGASGLPFPDATFLHSRDKPFEIHRAIVRLTPFDNATPPVILPVPFIGAIADHMGILEKYLRLRMTDVSKDAQMSSNPQLIQLMSRFNERTWEWEDPYTLVRAEGFSITVDSILAAYGVTVGNTTLTVGNVRVEITFEGYMIVIAPASEQR